MATREISIKLNDFLPVRKLNPEQIALFYSPQPETQTVNGLTLHRVAAFDPTPPHTILCTPIPPAKPNVFYIPNFVTPKELQKIEPVFVNNIQLFKASVLSQAHVAQEHRKSSFLPWPAQYSEAGDAQNTAGHLAQRAAMLVHSSYHNVETPQLLSYVGDGKQGNYFKMHHDMALFDSTSNFGWDEIYDTMEEQNSEFEDSGIFRLFTVFVYLNTLPTQEGHTTFPLLGIHQEPAQGAALLWPNVLPNGRCQPFTIHAGELVQTKDVQKFAMNLWVHADPFNKRKPMSHRQISDRRAIYKETVERIDKAWQMRFRNNILPRTTVMDVRPDRMQIMDKEESPVAKRRKTCVQSDQTCAKHRKTPVQADRTCAKRRVEEIFSALGDPDSDSD